jgi:DNA primase
MIPDEIVDEIRDRADVVALIGEHVQLRKAGVNHKGLCPFHQEKTPSFHVNPQRRSFYCFGCHKKGDVFNFLMELQGKGFVEVVREVAERVGVVIPERPASPEEQQRRTERARLLDVNAAAAAFYRQTLAADRGASARAYLKRRGIGDEVAHTFQLGAAPDAWDALVHHLEGRRAIDGALTLGLVAPRQNRNGFYDRFRNRVMCPVILPAGEIAGFSARTLAGDDPETPKYLNSPESLVYKKSHLLFGLHAARPAFARKGRALVVEGNFDVIALHQAGLSETVAPLGTAMTAEQIELLRRLAPAVVLCLDGDKAGRAAAMRAIPLLCAAGVDARVVALPDGDDPDSFVRRHGAAALEDLVGRARPAVEHFIDEVWFKSDRSPDARAAALREVAPLVAGIADEVKREMVVSQVALSMGVEQRVVRLAGREPGKQASPAPAPAPAPRAAAGPPPRLELKVIGILADHPDLVDEAEQLGIRSLLTDARLRDMYSARLAGQSFLDAAPKDISDLVAREIYSGAYATLSSPRRTLVETLRTLERERLEHDLDCLARDLKDAARRGDSDLARELSIRQIQTRKLAEELKRRPEEDPR